MNAPQSSERRCACRFTDAYDCWTSRYPSDPDTTTQDIETDGGPCHCCCHDERDEDYDPAEYLDHFDPYEAAGESHFSLPGGGKSL